LNNLDMTTFYPRLFSQNRHEMFHFSTSKYIFSNTNVVYQTSSASNCANNPHLTAKKAFYIKPRRRNGRQTDPRETTTH
jgi:hypothetical protein